MPLKKSNTVPSSFAPMPPIRTGEFSFSSGVTSTPAKALSYFLKNTPPADLHSRFLDAIENFILTEQDAQNLFFALKRVGLVSDKELAAVSDATPRHCARCHATYKEKDNHVDACKIAHDSPVAFKSASDRPQDQNFKFHYHCCNKMSEFIILPLDAHFCGRHTTLEKKVFYTGSNILRCETRKCSKPDKAGSVASSSAGPATGPAAPLTGTPSGPIPTQGRQ